MLENVSWGVFLKLLGIILTCYYGVLVVRYFRSDISSLLLIRNRVGLKGRKGKNTGEDNSSVYRLSVLLTEIDPEFMANAGEKAELIQLLRQKIDRYGLPDSNTLRKILLNHLMLVAKAGKADLKETDLLDLLSELQK